MKIAIIPARGGSKRIPNKNIKDFNGKPLIAHSIDAAKESGVFDKIIVSTDSDEIARVATDAGAEVPFMRPVELADDYTPTVPVILHAINWLIECGFIIDYFCCIYPNPFITSENIVVAFKLLKEKNVSSLIPVTTFPFPIFRSFKITKQGTLEYIYPENALVRSQDLPEAYHDVGQFYWCNCKTFLETNNILQPDTLPLIIPRYLSQDLDTPEDWEVAEKIYKAFMAEFQAIEN